MSDPTAAEMVERLDVKMTEALMQGRWADSEGIQNQLDGYRVQARRDADQALINELTDQLADAKRNEERAVAEVGELKDELKFAWSDDGDPLAIENKELKAKLNTLEAAVRAVEDDDYDRPSRLACLYALVTEVKL